jgi:hypothetical protein
MLHPGFLLRHYTLAEPYLCVLAPLPEKHIGKESSFQRGFLLGIGNIRINNNKHFGSLIIDFVGIPNSRHLRSMRGART